MQLYHLFVSFLADFLVVPIVLIAAYVLIKDIPKEKKFEAYSRILLAGLTTYLISKLLGSVFQPDVARPFLLSGHKAGALYLNNPGFPSDHALFGAAITYAVWFETKRKRVAVLLGILTIIVCVGRVLAMVHTPLDVLGGIVVASIGALWYLQRKLAISSATRQNGNHTV